MHILLLVLFCLIGQPVLAAGGYTTTLTRPANTTAYAAGNMVGTSTTAGSLVVPYFTMPNVPDIPTMPKGILTTNATTGWGGVSLQIDLWHSSAAPTFSGGDGAAYALTAGSANYIGSFTCTLTQGGDGAYGECVPVSGSATFAQNTNFANVYWTMSIQGAATPISGQTFTFTPEIIY